MDRVPVLAWLVLVPALGACSPSSEIATEAEPQFARTLLDYHGPADAFHHRVVPAAAMAVCEWHHPFVPAGKAALCERHRVALVDDVIPINYGFPLRDAPGFDEAERDEFPNYAARYLGGCMFGEEHWVAVAYCASCRAAELEWERASAAAGHPHPYDAASREENRREVAAIWPQPPLPSAR